MGDVISVTKKTLINESGAYVQDSDGRKAYMYDFFLQIDLASVNRKKNFNETEEEEEKESDDENDAMQGMKPSFIMSHLAASFSPAEADKPDSKNQANVKEFLQNQALDELSKARPVATVFFRFSHRDDDNKFLLVTKQKSIVNEVRESILNCQKSHTAQLVEDAIEFGIEVVKHRVPQTFLNFFDVYSIIDQ